MDAAPTNDDGDDDDHDDADDDGGGGGSRTVLMAAVGESSSQWQEWKGVVVPLTVRAAGASADNKVSIARLGGVEALLSALRRHEASVAVAEWACSALSGLAVNGERRARTRLANARACRVCGMWRGMGWPLVPCRVGNIQHLSPSIS